MHKWLAKSSLRDELDSAYRSIYHPFSSHCVFGDYLGVRGTSAQYCDTPDTCSIPLGTSQIWKYCSSMMVSGYVNDFQFINHRWAWKRVQRVAFTGNLQIGMTQNWTCPVNGSGSNQSRFSLAGQMTEPVESRKQTKMDAMYFIALSACDACSKCSCLAKRFAPCIVHSNYPGICSCLVRTRVLDRLGFWGCTDCLPGVSSGDGAPWTLCMGRWFID